MIDKLLHKRYSDMINMAKRLDANDFNLSDCAYLPKRQGVNYPLPVIADPGRQSQDPSPASGTDSDYTLDDSDDTHQGSGDRVLAIEDVHRDLQPGYMQEGDEPGQDEFDEYGSMCPIGVDDPESQDPNPTQTDSFAPPESSGAGEARARHPSPSPLEMAARRVVGRAPTTRRGPYDRPEHHRGQGARSSKISAITLSPVAEGPSEVVNLTVHEPPQTEAEIATMQDLTIEEKEEDPQLESTPEVDMSSIGVVEMELHNQAGPSRTQSGPSRTQSGQMDLTLEVHRGGVPSLGEEMVSPPQHRATEDDVLVSAPPPSQVDVIELSDDSSSDYGDDEDNEEDAPSNSAMDASQNEAAPPVPLGEAGPSSIAELPQQGADESTPAAATLHEDAEPRDEFYNAAGKAPAPGEVVVKVEGGWYAAMEARKKRKEERKAKAALELQQAQEEAAAAKAKAALEIQQANEEAARARAELEAMRAELARSRLVAIPATTPAVVASTPSAPAEPQSQGEADEGSNPEPPQSQSQQHSADDLRLPFYSTQSFSHAESPLREDPMGDPAVASNYPRGEDNPSPRMREHHVVPIPETQAQEEIPPAEDEQLVDYGSEEDVHRPADGQASEGDFRVDENPTKVLRPNPYDFD